MMFIPYKLILGQQPAAIRHVSGSTYSIDHTVENDNEFFG